MYSITFLLTLLACLVADSSMMWAALFGGAAVFCFYVADNLDPNIRRLIRIWKTRRTRSLR